MQVRPQYKMRFIGWNHLNWWPIKRYSLYVFEIEERSSTCLLFFRPLSFALQLLACMTERVLECPLCERRETVPSLELGPYICLCPLLWVAYLATHYSFMGILWSRLKLFVCIPATDNGGDFCLIFRKRLTVTIRLATIKIKMCCKTLYSKREVEAEAWLGMPIRKMPPTNK